MPDRSGGELAMGAPGSKVEEPLALNELFSLRDASRKLLSTKEPQKIAELLISTIQEGFHFPRIEVYLRDPEHHTYVPVNLPGGGTLCPEREIIEWVTKEEKPTTIPSGENHWVTVVPLAMGQQSVGLLCAETTDVAEHMTQRHLEILQELGTVAGASILNAQLLSQVQNQYLLLNNILDSITNGIITLDMNRVVSRMNRNVMAMLEISPEALDQPVASSLSGEVLEVFEDLFRKTTEDTFALERMAVHKLSSGIELNLAVSTSLLRDENFATLGVIYVLRDMTASRELDRLRRLDQLKSEFVANVSHELKTPLTSIKAYTEALIDMVDGIRRNVVAHLPDEQQEESDAQFDQQKEFLKVVDEESDRLLYLINDLLNVARIQAGKLKLNLEIHPPDVIVREVMGLSKVQSDKHHIVLELNENLHPMVMDKEKLKEVMINLISNAIKYSPKGGKVWVRMRDVESNLEIEIQDQGLGIAKEHLPRLFDQFYRVDNSLTYEIPGTGLGLSIVKAIIEAHGGKVGVTSEVGEGSKFSIMIPIRKEWKPQFDLEQTFVD